MLTGILARGIDGHVGGFDLDKLLAFVTGAGFSVFVSCWFMLKHDKSLTELTAAINELRLFLQIEFRKGGDHGSN